MHHEQSYEQPPGRQLAVGLGWFSIALGVAELAAPRAVARLIGVVPTSSARTMLRAYGAREVANGIAILAQPDNPTWLWSRVGGDALDVASIAHLMREPGTDNSKAAVATMAVLGVTALDVMCAQQLSAPRDATTERAATARRTKPRQPVNQAITINATEDQIRELWRTPDRLPEALRALDLEGDGVSGGMVTLTPAPAGRGIEVRIRVPQDRAGSLRDRMASVAGRDVASRLHDDLRKVKQILETGEVVLSDGPSLWRAAQPSATPRKLQDMAGV